MNATRALLAVAAMLPLLSGCVAAALPVLAAGGVFGTQIERGEAKPADRGAPRVSVDITPLPSTASAGTLTRNYTLADGTRMEVMTGSSAALPSPAGTIPAAPAAPVVAPLIAMPAPVAATGFAGYDAFHGFADRKGTLPIADSDRRSAMLADPEALTPVTSECSIQSAAVLIDLDPAGAALDPAAAVHADPAFASALADLRMDGVAIGWLSSNTADRAGAVRRALVASGLDPAGRDALALLRYPEERKQTRREDFAKEFCVVAIAGDDRSDFDEVFQYLKDPSLAAPLDALIGNGWFLIPQPLS